MYFHSDRMSPTVFHIAARAYRIDTPLIWFYRMQKKEKRFVKQYDMRTHPLLLNVNYVPSNQDVVLIHKLIASSEIYCEHLYSDCVICMYVLVLLSVYICAAVHSLIY